MEVNNMLKDYTVQVYTNSGEVWTVVIEGYASAHAALNVVITQFNSRGGVVFNNGTLFIPAHEIINIKVRLDVR